MSSQKSMIAEPRAKPSNAAAPEPENSQGWPRIWVNSKAFIGIFSRMSGSTSEFWVNPVNLPYCKTETNMTKRTLSCTRQSLSSVAPVMVSGLPRLFSIVCDHLQHLQPSLKPFSLHSRSSRSSRCSSFYFFFFFLRFFRANDCALAVSVSVSVSVPCVSHKTLAKTLAR